MRRSRLILLITGGAVLLLAMSVVVAVVVAFVLQAPLQPADRCVRSVESCSDALTVAQIAELSGVDLPEGSEVIESEYRSALDWTMSATVRLPQGSPSPVLDPDLIWDGSTLGPDGVVREVTSTVGDDGRIVLELHAFDV